MDYVLKLKLDNHRTDPKKGVGLSSLEANNLHVLLGVSKLSTKPTLAKVTPIIFLFTKVWSSSHLC